MAKRPVEEALLAAGEPEAEEEILSVREELKKQLWLAGPMIAGALLQNVIQMISVMYVGHLGELPLAGASMANSFATVTGLSLLVTTYLLLLPSLHARMTCSAYVYCCLIILRNLLYA